jgi:hypothetical protein
MREGIPFVDPREGFFCSGDIILIFRKPLRLLRLVERFGPRNLLIREFKAAVRTFGRFQSHCLFTSRALFRSALFYEKPHEKDGPS